MALALLAGDRLIFDLYVAVFGIIQFSAAGDAGEPHPVHPTALFRRTHHIGICFFVFRRIAVVAEHGAAIGAAMILALGAVFSCLFKHMEAILTDQLLRMLAGCSSIVVQDCHIGKTLFVFRMLACRNDLPYKYRRFARSNLECLIGVQFFGKLAQCNQINLSDQLVFLNVIIVAVSDHRLRNGIESTDIDVVAALPNECAHIA